MAGAFPFRIPSLELDSTFVYFPVSVKVPGNLHFLPLALACRVWEKQRSTGVISSVNLQVSPWELATLLLRQQNALSSRFEICSGLCGTRVFESLPGVSVSWCSSEAHQSPIQALLEETVFSGISKGEAREP